jgi:DnaK suppressor protein
MDYSEIRKQLQTKLRELVARAKDIEENLSQPGEADWEENATESEGDEVMIGIGELTKKEIQQIEQALQLIDDGTYGKCQTCGKPIEKARLELLPFTSSCVACA